jgi:hypothetical protein
MSYNGQVVEIKLGKYGLMYDLAQDQLPNDALIRSENIQFMNGMVEKADEILPWIYSNPSYTNPNFTGEKILAVHRYFPSPMIEKHVCVTDAGKVYKYDNSFIKYEVTAQTSAPTTLSINSMPIIVSGGNEVLGNPKKVFVFTGNSKVQVIEGDGTTRRNLTSPAADWSSGNYPTYGLIFRNRLVAISGHNVYMSAADNQEDFVTNPGYLVLPCFPGEAEGIISSFVYKGRLFVFKRPYGVYALIDTDADPTNWYFEKISPSFGIASPRSFFQNMDDMFVLSTEGSLVGISAALRLGDTYSADLLSNLKTDSYFHDLIRKQFLRNAFGGFLPSSKIGIIAIPSYKSSDGYSDNVIQIDFNNTDLPRVSIQKYVASSFTCVDYHKNAYGEDQFLFGRLNYSGGVFSSSELATHYPENTADTPFRFQTPHMNLGVPANKIFEGFELVTESGSVYPLAVDVFIDGKLKQTFAVQPFYNGALGPSLMGSLTQYANPIFTLDTSYTGGRAARPKLHSIKARGQTISFLVRDGNTINMSTGAVNADSGIGDGYPKKIVGIRVYFRVAGQDSKSQTA